MKKVLFTAALLTLSGFSFGGELDGKTFCRVINRTRPMMGQPAGKRTHCVSFAKNRARDNSPTFFGNPPESYRYSVYGVKIINEDRDKETGYEILGDDRIILKETGAVLHISPKTKTRR